MDKFKTAAPPSACSACRLATSEIGSVEACLECGMVRLNVQALSLRLDPDAFQVLALMVGEAHGNLCRYAESIASRAGMTGAKSH